LGLAALAPDGLWDDQLDSIPCLQHHGIPLNSLKKILHHFRHNWSCSNLPLSDVQNGVFQPHLRQRSGRLK